MLSRARQGTALPIPLIKLNRKISGVARATFFFLVPSAYFQSSFILLNFANISYRMIFMFTSLKKMSLHSSQDDVEIEIADPRPNSDTRADGSIELL